MIWFTSDPHFGHKGVIEFCKRPYSSVEAMDKALIENWKKCVRKNEQVYVLGDFAFCKKERMKEILSQLPGQKILIKGNHDRDAKYMLDAGFDKVLENEEIKLGDKKILLSHFPYHPVTQHITLGNKIIYHGVDQNIDTRYLHKRILDDGKTILLHGHVHTAYKQKGRMINVGVDQWNFKPVSHEQILKLIEGIK